MGQIEISTAVSCDIPYLKRMWKDIFNDTDSYIDLYFSYKFKEGNTFVVKDEGKIVSTLYVEYNSLYVDGCEKKGAYFCGIATYEEYRKKGYANMLIQYAKENIKNVDIIYLIPANLPLFDFYKKSGFKEFTYMDKEEICIDKKIELPGFSKEFDYTKVNNFYENSGNKIYVKRDEAFFNAIYECYKNIMIFPDGYVIYYIDENKVHLVEYSFKEDKAKEILKGIISKENLKSGILYKKWGKTPFSVCITDLDIEKIDKRYINLMLN